jgi:molybdopterin molybdotransferase
MTKPITCADNISDPTLLTVEKTLQAIQAGIKPLSLTQKQHIRDALGHVLAEDVTSGMDVPPHRNSAMDGYAINSEDLDTKDEITLNVIGISYAGAPFTKIVNKGECIRIMTGAMMAEGTDTVIMQEYVKRTEDVITLEQTCQPGENVRYPGEDIKKGSVILRKGKLLSPADLGLLSSVGINEVKTFCKPRVAFFSTGDELKSLGEILSEGDIYDSNRYTLFGMLKRMDVELLDLGVIADDRAIIKATLEDAAQHADMIITSGGASVGDADYISEILQEIGQVNFWKIAMKPGKPLAFGNINGTPYFGLPGNPVSVMATCYLFVQPAIQCLKGLKSQSHLSIKAKLVNSLKKAPGRTDFQRGILSQNQNGEVIVDTTGMQGSHILTSMSHANCFIVIPQESGNVAAGEMVEVLPFNGII